MIITERQKEKTLAVDKGKEDNLDQKKNLAVMGCGSISQRTRDCIDVTLVHIVVVRKKDGGHLGASVYFWLCSLTSGLCHKL